MRLLDRLKHLFSSHKPETIATVKRSTKTHPTPRDVFVFALSRIDTELESGRDVAYAVFQHQENDKAFGVNILIRCKRECNGALLNSAIHYQKAPDQLLSQVSVEFPADCRPTLYDPAPRLWRSVASRLFCICKT